ncbi:MAG: hypothetical protein E6K58_03070 [Nitrospirae bacterium]|nr:MAG: hypothetical protein E6K58_03070 [Nitrospirota bacterium]
MSLSNGLPISRKPARRGPGDAQGYSTMHWYVINTKPHREKEAELQLKRLSVETFLPLLRRSKIIRRMRKTVTGPLFPGYLFARFDLNEHHRAVSYARGVRKIVEFGSTPARVDEELIQGMKTRLCNGYVSLAPRLLAPGQVVKIQDGPLSGFEAVFEREMPDHQRVVLLLRTLAYQARVVVPSEQVANL